MTRRSGIAAAVFFVLLGIASDWMLGVAPNPYRAPDPIAWGSSSGASGAICTFAPPTPGQ